MGIKGKITKTELDNDLVTEIENSSSDLQQIKSKQEELYTNVSNGKSKIATSITNKGVSTSSTDTFDTMSNNINKIKLGDYNKGQTLSLSQFEYLYTEKIGTEYKNKKSMDIKDYILYDSSHIDYIMDDKNNIYLYSSKSSNRKLYFYDYIKQTWTSMNCSDNIFYDYSYKRTISYGVPDYYHIRVFIPGILDIKIPIGEDKNENLVEEDVYWSDPFLYTVYPYGGGAKLMYELTHSLGHKGRYLTVSTNGNYNIRKFGTYCSTYDYIVEGGSGYYKINNSNSPEIRTLDYDGEIISRLDLDSSLNVTYPCVYISSGYLLYYNYSSRRVDCYDIDNNTVKTLVSGSNFNILNSNYDFMILNNGFIEKYTHSYGNTFNKVFSIKAPIVGFNQNQCGFNDTVLVSNNNNILTMYNNTVKEVSGIKLK